MRGTRSTGAIARYATHARNFGITKNPESSDRDFAALIFSVCVIGLPLGAFVGLTVFLTWFQ